MAKGTKKIKTQKDFTSELNAWKGFIHWLGEQEDDTTIYNCMMFEIKHQNRPAFIDRARTRFNRVRSKRELIELEKISGKVISIAGR